MSRASLFVFLGACFVFAPLSRADQADIDWDKVLAGNVVVEAVENGEGIPGVKASFCVKAGRDAIWSALTEYSDFPKIYKGLNKINVLESTESGAKVEIFYSVNFLKIFHKELHYVVDRRYPSTGREIRWSKISGNVKRIDGSWEIHETARDGTYLLVYCSYVEPEEHVPALFVRKSAMKEAADMAHRLRTWIEKKFAGQDEKSH